MILKQLVQETDVPPSNRVQVIGCMPYSVIDGCCSVDFGAKWGCYNNSNKSKKLVPFCIKRGKFILGLIPLREKIMCYIKNE